MSAVIYHYSGLSQKAPGELIYFDGVATCARRIETQEEYKLMKKRISEATGHPYDRITILSLELL